MVEKTGPRTRRQGWSKVSRDPSTFDVVMTPPALKIIGGKDMVRVRLTEALSVASAGRDGSPDLVLWRYGESERVVALINRHIGRVFVDYFGGPGSNPHREDAIRAVCLGIGSHPELPSGAEYVRRVRGVWKGLLPLERRAS